MRVAVMITALLLTALAATALAETKVREYDDRVVVEVTGTPQKTEERAAQDRQEQLRSLEYERQRLTAEQERLQRSEDGGSLDMRERRTAMMEKHRQIQQVEEQLRDLAQQSLAEGSSAAAAR